jgi:tRNA pseudouridine13 synthase
MNWSSDWPRGHDDAVGHGVIRSNMADFRVREELGFEADGEGEHALLHIEKTDQNTADIVRQVASLAGVQESVIGFCGMKDRRAVTSQYFSVGLAGLGEAGESVFKSFVCGQTWSQASSRRAR